MNQTLVLSVVAAAACVAPGDAHAQETSTEATEKIEVVGKRETRISKGATGLPLTIKDTPQSISTIDKEDLENYGVTGSNEALRLSTGINVEQYETNRATFNSRGFEIQLTQLDGLGMSNDWGTVVGQLDTFLFERIELIRGANGLLTGVGNASGTVNYVRKRPTNKDSGEIGVTGGSYAHKRAMLDANKVFTEDGSWAGRLVMAHEDKDSYLRDLHDQRTSLYAVIDGQIGDNGVITFGVTALDAQQDSPMWGSLTLNYLSGGQAEFDVSASSSQKWTHWDTRSLSAFVEYTHALGNDWEAKLTYNHRKAEEDVQLLYAYAPAGGLNDDNTGLIGWPYASFVSTENNLFDANLTGHFKAFGRNHSLIAGISHSTQKTTTDTRAPAAEDMFLPLPAFPYEGDAYQEPDWGPRTPTSAGEQTLTRLYAATRVAVTDQLKLIGGVNAIHLERSGSSRYGNVVDATAYPDTEEFSPYVGLTYDVTPDVLGYVSYSDIFQNQDQTDFEGNYLAPMKGVNVEAGVKAEWFGKQLLTTLAVFSAEQKGLATQGDGLTPDGNFWYRPVDAKSRGVEAEATGRFGRDTRLTLGITHLELDVPTADDYPWVPRTTVNFRADTRLAALPQLKLGVNGRWQSKVTNAGGTVKQDAFFVANAFAAYDFNKQASLRLNVNNLFNQKYIGGLAYGAIYGAPRNATVSVNYKF
jgi:outer membrane receptor for ferric coprogen and ferric-rhodotorulic acid